MTSPGTKRKSPQPGSAHQRGQDTCVQTHQSTDIYIVSTVCQAQPQAMKAHIPLRPTSEFRPQQ